MTTHPVRRHLPLGVAGGALCLLSLTACGGGSATRASASGATTGSSSSGTAKAVSAATAAAPSSVDACGMVTVAELSAAVGVQYKAITAAGGLCSVSGPGSAGFDYSVQAESAGNTWSEQVATIKGDDGQALSEPGLGDRAVWGGKEFAAEADGYIVGVIGADFPSTPQGSGFTRTGKIAKLLISKL